MHIVKAQVDRTSKSGSHPFHGNLTETKHGGLYKDKKSCWRYKPLLVLVSLYLSTLSSMTTIIPIGSVPAFELQTILHLTVQ